jgi:hypothetical protein
MLALNLVTKEFKQIARLEMAYTYLFSLQTSVWLALSFSFGKFLFVYLLQEAIFPYL